MDQKNKMLAGLFVAQIYKSKRTQEENNKVIINNSFADNTCLALKNRIMPNTRAKTTETP